MNLYLSWVCDVMRTTAWIRTFTIFVYAEFNVPLGFTWFIYRCKCAVRLECGEISSQDEEVKLFSLLLILSFLHHLMRSSDVSHYARHTYPNVFYSVVSKMLFTLVLIIIIIHKAKHIPDSNRNVSRFSCFHLTFVTCFNGTEIKPKSQAKALFTRWLCHIGSEKTSLLSCCCSTYGNLVRSYRGGLSAH